MQALHWRLIFSYDMHVLLRLIHIMYDILVGTDRYVDVSTVDAATSKLISGHIKATGASFLEVKLLS